MRRTLDILILDDLPNPALELVRKALELLGRELDPEERDWQVTFGDGTQVHCSLDVIQDLDEASRMLTTKQGRNQIEGDYDLVLVDNNWAVDGGAVDWGLTTLESNGPPAQCVTALFTIAPNPDFVRRAIHAGVHSLVRKSENDNYHLLNLFYVALYERELRERRNEDACLAQSVVASAGHTALQSQSPLMQRCIEAAVKLANAPGLNLLLLGETGTGKTWLARHIHMVSHRSEQAFEPVDFGQIPVELAESVLFGHEKGAFTGAVAARPGIFELASQGTILIDEIHAIPASVRQSLLKVTDPDDRSYRRVGSTVLRRTDARIISASNHDAEVLRDGLKDLYPRLAQITIELPALRDRVEDIRPLAAKFLRSANKRFREEQLPVELTEDALCALEEYKWPYNIRELKSTIDRSVVMASSASIGPSEMMFDHSISSAEELSPRSNEFSETERLMAMTVRPRRGQQQYIFDLLLERSPHPVTYAELNQLLKPPSEEADFLDVRLNHLLSRIRSRLEEVGFVLERRPMKQEYRLARKTD